MRRLGPIGPSTQWGFTWSHEMRAAILRYANDLERVDDALRALKTANREKAEAEAEDLWRHA